ncbi:MAG: hypothetical protein JXM73_25390 [Anaerolineae bacterium]|nr:hypothetical protein [Anaerolineae bacterium]
MLKQLLFETRLGEALLAFAEKRLGIAIVDADWLGQRRSTVTTMTSTVVAR